MTTVEEIFFLLNLFLLINLFIQVSIKTRLNIISIERNELGLVKEE